MLRLRRLQACLVLLLLCTAIDAAAMDIRPWRLPPMPDAAQPDLVASPTGNLLLSWMEKSGDQGHSLRYSRYLLRPASSPTPKWQEVKTIASGKGWFVNWADTPHLLVLPNGTLWAHWLRRSGAGAYDYGIALVRSSDDGATWSAPIRIEPEGSSNDHGFVSLWPHSRDQLGIAWLDSRQKPRTDAESGHDHEAHGGAPMMMRAAVFDDDGRRVIEWPLDGSTCDCCPTSVALSGHGPVVVYRGRSPEEIRDTRLVRHDGKAWTPPVTVHADGWKFAGCPVNGPAVVAREQTVWVAWYTEADGQPSLRLARSSDAGDHFDAPLHIAEGRDVLGRVALAMDGDTVWIAWLVESDRAQALWLARVDGESGRVIERQKVADLATRGRSSGLPKLQAMDGAAWLVWTDVVAGKSTVQGVSIR